MSSYTSATPPPKARKRGAEHKDDPPLLPDVVIPAPANLEQDFSPPIDTSGDDVEWTPTPLEKHCPTSASSAEAASQSV